MVYYKAEDVRAALRVCLQKAVMVNMDPRARFLYRIDYLSIHDPPTRDVQGKIRGVNVTISFSPKVHDGRPLTLKQCQEYAEGYGSQKLFQRGNTAVLEYPLVDLQGELKGPGNKIVLHEYEDSFLAPDKNQIEIIRDGVINSANLRWVMGNL